MLNSNDKFSVKVYFQNILRTVYHHILYLHDIKCFTNLYEAHMH